MRLLTGRRSGQLAIGLCLLAIVPFVALARYAEPSYDDWCMAQRLHDLGFWRGIQWWYQHWAGRFSAIVAWNVIPISRESLAGYRVAPVVLLAALYGGAFALCAEILHGLATKRQAAGVAAAFLAAWLFAMPSPAEGLYWYSGWTVTTLGVAFALPAVAAAIHAARGATTASRFVWTAAAGLMSFVAAGANEIVIVLQGIVFAALLWRARRTSVEHWRLLIVPLLAVVIAAAVDVPAPGNYARAQTAGSMHGVVGPLVGSAAFALTSVLAWLSRGPLLIGGLMVMLAGAVAASRIAAESAWRRTHWATPAVIAVAAIWGMYAFTHWASGFSFRPGPPDRVMNVALAAWLSLAAVSAFMAGIQLPAMTAVAEVLRPARPWMLVVFALALFGEGGIRGAWEDLASGRASSYRRELDARHQLMRQASGQPGEMEVPPLTRIPVTLHFKDITADAGQPPNGCYAAFWGVRGVKLAPPR